MFLLMEEKVFTDGLSSSHLLHWLVSISLSLPIVQTISNRSIDFRFISSHRFPPFEQQRLQISLVFPLNSPSSSCIASPWQPWNFLFPLSSHPVAASHPDKHPHRVEEHFIIKAPPSLRCPLLAFHPQINSILLDLHSLFRNTRICDKIIFLLPSALSLTHCLLPFLSRALEAFVVLAAGSSTVASGGELERKRSKSAWNDFADAVWVGGSARLHSHPQPTYAVKL